LVALASITLGCDPVDPEPPPGTSWPPPRFVVVEEGTGPANELPLEPLPVGALYAQTGEVVVGRLGGGWASRRVLRERDGFVLMHRAEGLHYGGLVGSGGRGGHDSATQVYRVTERGVEALDASVGESFVLVPATVRLGMVWETGETNVRRFEVTGRAVERTPVGDAVVWTLDGGPAGGGRYAEGIGFLGGDGLIAQVDTIVLPDEEPEPLPALTALETVPLTLGASVEARVLYDVEPWGLTAIETASGALLISVRNRGGYVNDPCWRVEGGTIEAEAARPFALRYDPIPRLETGPLEGCPVRIISEPLVYEREQLASDASGITLREDGTALYAPRDTSSRAEFYLGGLSGGIGAPIGAFVGARGPELLYTAANSFNERDGEAFGLIGDAAVGESLGSWPFMRAISHGTMPRNVTDVGTWILPLRAEIPAEGARLYYLSTDGTLLRTRLTETELAPPDVLFHVDGDPSFRVSPEGREVWLTDRPGQISRLVTDEGGEERVERFGFMALARGEELVGAVRAGDADHVIALVLDTTTAGNGLLGQYVFGSAKLYLVTLGEGTIERAPPSLDVSAIASGADAVVCWPETDAPLVREGWTLQGRPAVVTPTAGNFPCVMVSRADGATAADLAAPDAFHVRGPIPGVGVVSVAASAGLYRDFGVPHRDATPVEGGFVWNTDAWIFGQTLRDTWNDRTRPFVADFSGGVWSSDYTPGTLPTSVHYWDLSHHELDADVSARDMGFATLAGVMVDGGAVYRVRGSGSELSGPLYRIERDGTTTPLAPDGTYPWQYWFADGTRCELDGGAMYCADREGASTSSPPATPMGNNFQVFADGSVLIYNGAPPRRWERETNTFTQLDDRPLVRVVRAVDGTLYGVIRDDPSQVGGLVRVEITGLVDLDLAPPSWIEGDGWLPYSVFPVGDTIGVMWQRDREEAFVRYALPAP